MDLGIGVIGAGVMGADHARTIAATTRGARLAAVSDADPGRASTVAGTGRNVRVHADPFALIADPDVRAVLIASPDETHVPYTLACIAAGKPVLCEKPLAPTAEGALEVIAAEAATGRRLVQVGFMRRFDPGYAAMKATLTAGHLGGPLMMHCVHRNAQVPPWFTADMVISNSAVHEIDVARWMLDDDFTAATAFFRAGSEGQGPSDRQFLVLETGRGVVVDVEVYLNAKYGYDVGAEVVCENGTVALAPHAPVGTRFSGAQSIGYAPDWRAHFEAAYRLQLQAWVDGIVAGTPAGASAWDGYAASATADACVAAARQGGRVAIRLAQRPDLYR